LPRQQRQQITKASFSKRKKSLRKFAIASRVCGFVLSVLYTMLTMRLCADKTKVFSDEIEKKQRELQPWTAKIQAKQTEVDVRISERDMLVKKGESVKQALEEAEASLQSLQDEQVKKVC
jgi:hypothetical protein